MHLLLFCWYIGVKGGKMTNEGDGTSDRESRMTNRERQPEKRDKTTRCVRETTKNGGAVNVPNT